MVGKWDMGQAKRYLPLQRGFDFFYGHGNNGIDYYTHERYGIHSLFAGNARTKADQGTYATDLFKREALRFIREQQGSSRGSCISASTRRTGRRALARTRRTRNRGAACRRRTNTSPSMPTPSCRTT